MLGYCKAIKFHLLPEIGSYRIDELTPLILKGWLYKFNHRTKTIRNVLIPLQRILKSATNDGLISSNPIDDLDLTEIIKDIGLPKQDEIDPFNDYEKEYLIV